MKRVASARSIRPSVDNTLAYPIARPIASPLVPRRTPNVFEEVARYAGPGPTELHALELIRRLDLGHTTCRPRSAPMEPSVALEYYRPPPVRVPADGPIFIT